MVNFSEFNNGAKVQKNWQLAPAMSCHCLLPAANFEPLELIFEYAELGFYR